MGRVVKFLREGDGCGIGVAAVVAAQHLHIRSGDARHFTFHVSRHTSHVAHQHRVLSLLRLQCGPQQ